MDFWSQRRVTKDFIMELLLEIIAASQKDLESLSNFLKREEGNKILDFKFTLGGSLPGTPLDNMDHFLPRNPGEHYLQRA
jgi:hypothetical protein